MCIARVLRRSFRDGRHQTLLATCNAIFNDFPSSSFPCSDALSRCSFVGKSAINIECHVGCYDVLIDCLTTNRLEAISTKREAFDDGKTFEALPRGFSLWRVRVFLLDFFFIMRQNVTSESAWCIVTLIGIIMTSVGWLQRAKRFMRCEFGNVGKCVRCLKIERVFEEIS